MNLFANKRFLDDYNHKFHLLAEFVDYFDDLKERVVVLENKVKVLEAKQKKI